MTGPRPAPPFDAWSWWLALNETFAAGLDPPGVGQRLRERRLRRLLETAQRDSPLYRRRGAGARRLADFEPVDKPLLMRHFDDWACDRRITRAGAEAFLAARNNLADAWLGRYLLWTSSGTSGLPGIFVQDAASLAAYDAIDALRLRGGGLAQPQLGLWGLGRRFAYVGAIGGHFAGHVSLTRLLRLAPPGLAPRLDLLSVLEPLDTLAEQLQALQPQVLITYPSCAAALAQRQAAGTLRLQLAELWLGGEQVTPAQHRLLRSAFGCALRNSYGASEFFSIAFECEHGRLHLNADWVLLEAVDAHDRPVPAGAPAQGVLLTHLANLTQPLIRYRLGDRVQFDAARCACGSLWPVIEVQGRCDDTLLLPARRGGTVTLLPLALETAIEDGAQVAAFQLLQLNDGSLELRVEAAQPGRGAALQACRHALAAFLAAHGVARVAIACSNAAPLQQPGSGKVRRVVDLGRQGAV